MNPTASAALARLMGGPFCYEKYGEAPASSAAKAAHRKEAGRNAAGARAFAANAAGVPPRPFATPAGRKAQGAVHGTQAMCSENTTAERPTATMVR